MILLTIGNANINPLLVKKVYVKERNEDWGYTRYYLMVDSTCVYNFRNRMYKGENPAEVKVLKAKDNVIELIKKCKKLDRKKRREHKCYLKSIG